MTPEAHLSHQLPRRVRLKVPSKKGDKEYFEKVVSAFNGQFGVVTANPMTGSILFRSEVAPVDAGRIAAEARAKQLFEVAPETPGKAASTAPVGGMALADHFAGPLRSLNARIQSTTRGKLDLPSVIMLGLVGNGVAQLLAGNAGPLPWYTALWYASGVFTRTAPKKQASAGQEADRPPALPTPTSAPARRPPSY